MFMAMRKGEGGRDQVCVLACVCNVQAVAPPANLAYHTPHWVPFRSWRIETLS
jgi:hypothetical protein